MRSDLKTNLEIGHVLFIEIIGYSRLRLNEQHESLHKLSEIVCNTDVFLAAEAAEKLLRLSTGNGIALVFSTAADEPVRCAMQISKGLRNYPELKVRIGVHSGPVSRMTDVNDRVSVAGAGINVAQRIMDCGDAGHILLSKRAAESLAQQWQWKSHLHTLGECELIPGEPVSVVNFYTDEAGNRSVPEKFKHRSTARRDANGSVRLSPVPAQNTLLAILFFSAVVVAIGYWILFPPSASNASRKPAGPEIQILTAAGKGEPHSPPSFRSAGHQ